MYHAKKKGFSIMEVVLSAALFGLFATVLVSAIIYGQETARITGMHARAARIAEEGLEVIRNIRDEAFSHLSDGTYGLTLVDNQWSLLGSNDVVGEFTRQVVISSIDTKTKKASVTVTWPQNLQRIGTISVVSYVTNWAALGIGSWATPLQQAVVDIPENQDATKVQTVGNYAYVLRGNGNPNFAIIDMSVLDNPTIAGSLTLNGNPSNIAVEGDYAYISSEEDNEELQIVSIVDPTNPTLTGVYDASGKANGAGIAVVSSTVYVGRSSSNNDEFYIINAINPANPTFIGSLNVGDTINDIVVSGSHAYFGTDNKSTEVQVASILDAANPSLVETYNISGNTDALSLAIQNSTTLLVGTANDTLYTLNISSPESLSLYGSLEIGGKVHAISLGNANNYAFLATGSNSAELQIIDVTTPATPSVLGTLDINGSVTGVAYSSALDRAICAGAGNSEEVIIVQPQ